MQGATSLKLYYVIAYQKVDGQHIEKISLTLILLNISDIYFLCYLATNEKIAITHLWRAVGPQTVCRLVSGGGVAEQHILGKTTIVLELQWLYSTVRISK